MAARPAPPCSRRRCRGCGGRAWVDDLSPGCRCTPERLVAARDQAYKVLIMRLGIGAVAQEGLCVAEWYQKNLVKKRGLSLCYWFPANWFCQAGPCARLSYSLVANGYFANGRYSDLGNNLPGYAGSA